METGADGPVLVVEDKDGGVMKPPADKILVTVGRKPNTEGWGLDAMGVKLEGGFVKVDDRCSTSVGGVWAIGDLVGEPMLEHKAATQGEMVAEIIAGGKRRRFDPVAIRRESRFDKARKSSKAGSPRRPPPWATRSSPPTSPIPPTAAPFRPALRTMAASSAWWR